MSAPTAPPSVPRIGELFAGYGGLGVGVQAALGGEITWVSEFDKGANKILAHRFPGVPNHGDITKIKWAPDCPTCGGSMAVYRRHVEGDALNEWAGEPFYWCPACEREWDVSIRHNDPDAERIPEPVDILTGGSPCQDLSHAGRRAGMTEGTRSNLWVAMREAIAQLRPGLVVWENVRGAFSAAADSEVEPCAGCVGDGSGVHLRALGRVLGDLSDLGYDASWHGLRAADVGAPHGRFRVFVVATDAQRGGRHGWASDTFGQSLERVAAAGSGEDAGGLRVLPTPSARDWKDHTIRREPHRPDDVDTLARALTGVPCALLPTPMVGDASSACNSTATRNKIPPTGIHAGDTLTDIIRGAREWGDYAAAIARWEQILSRSAPAPTMTSAKGNPQLSPAFVEWMMGLPAGWVTDVPGITRNEALKALGNGVCPQQAAAALREMFAWEVAA